MPSVNTNSPLQLGTHTRREYVSTAPFYNDFFSYTVTMNSSYKKIGTLSPVTGDHNIAPANRVLRENGKIMYPDAYPGVTTYMVGVYDEATSLSGFIDPNSPIFAVYNTDKPYFMANGVDPGPGGLVDRANPVYTNGSIFALSNALIGGNTTTSNSFYAGSNITASNSIYAASNITASNSIYASSNITASKSIYASSNIIASRQVYSSGSNDLGTITSGGQVVTLNASLGSVFTVTANVGGTVSASVNASNVTTGQRVFLILNIGDSVSLNNFTLIFGNNIREYSSFVPATVSTMTFSFIGVGSVLMETSRLSILPG